MTDMTDMTSFEIDNLFNLKGWVAVVTGGGTGLGLMASQALAANGAKVYATGRRVERLKQAEMRHASGGSIVALQMDVTDKASIKAGVEHIESKEGHVNLLVNNAGVSSVNYGAGGSPTGDARSVSEAMLGNQDFGDWLDVYRVNVAACYFVSAAFLPLLVAARQTSNGGGFAEAGSIINVSSISGLTKTSQNGQFAYNASKAGTVSLTEQLAVDFSRPEILVRVNQLAPGYFPSEMTAIAQHAGRDAAFFRERWGTPFGRAGTARDYAQALLNFAVNGFVTGSTLIIDGGFLLAHP